MPADISHLHSLFENATEGIILTGTKGVIVLMNPAAEKMFGYSAGEVIGQPVEILIPESVRPHHHQLREGFYHHPSNRVMGQGRDLYGMKKDGTALPVEVSLSHYERNNELFVIAFIVDITRRKQIEDDMLLQQQELKRVSDEIRKLNADLETKVEERTLILKEAMHRLEQSQDELSRALDKERQLNEIKGRFVSMASHEFRTPLSTVLSSASLLGKYTGADEQEKRNRHIDKIKTSVKHLNDILEDFLSLGKLDEDKIAAQYTTFDLPDFLNEIRNEMEDLLKEKQHIHLQYEGERIISTDKKLLRNILINLLSNAIKFSGTGQDVLLQVNVQAGQYVLTVKDQGMGIPESDLPHLFTSFFRASNAMNIQGTGLGLHIIKRYLDLIGGSVTVKSRINEGTAITITLQQRQPSI